MRSLFDMKPAIRSTACHRLGRALCVVFGAARLMADDFQGSTHLFPFDEEPIQYSQQKPEDPVTVLQRKLDAGEVKLAFDDTFGYLPALLEHFDIPASSQGLVFSKTSLQRMQITPANPRAIYFNDDVYIGYIPGSAKLELSTVDPKLGGTFYHLEQEKVRRPQFVLGNDCLNCHASPRTMGVPGHLVRSIATDETGELDNLGEVNFITHRSPLADRWAGWYVTGRHGDQAHRGNLIGRADFEKAAKEPNWRGNLDDLSPFFDTSKFPVPGSDIVALSVLTHQTHMHNYITRLNYETRQMMKWYGHIRYLTPQIRAFLRYLLLTEEATLTAPLQGNPDFVKHFEARGPRDGRGRSLRDLDLQTRLFKHPCSFLIYSEAFDNLPDIMRAEIYRRLHDILTGKDTSGEFAGLAAADRQAILEILLETKPGLPEEWRKAAE
jgi:hypothetical protein